LTDSYYKGKSTDELLQSLYNTAQVGSPVYEQIKVAITTRLAESLTQSIDKLRLSQEESTKVSDRLAQRMYWLNWAIAWAAVGTFLIAAIQAKLISWGP